MAIDESTENESGSNDSQEGQGATKMSASNIVDERGVPLTNTLKEFNRKLGRISDLSSKIDLLLQTQNKPASAAVDNTLLGGTDLDDSTKRYIDARLMEDKRAGIEKKQEAVIQNVLKTFPELDANSESYDSEFYNLAVSYEKTMDPMDPDRPLKAAKLAALDTGRIEKITKAKVIQDDNRRTRMLSEGGVEAKESRKEKSTSMNKSAIKNLLKIDPAKIEKIIKERQ